MDRHTSSSRQSSLPSSLIPHLYSAPRDSGTRTTLQPVSPLLSLSYDYNDAWREGEPGPSSLLHHRRGASHPPPRVPDWHTRQESYALERDPFSQSVPFALHSSSRTFQGLPPPHQLLVPSSEPTSASFSFDRHDAYSYPPLSMDPITPPRIKTPESPEIPHQSMFYHRPDTPPSGGDHGASNDEADSQKGKRQRADSLDTDDNARKTRNPRKTAVACNFCRGRKLRCNGAKPSCYNCTVRKFECEYVPIQRRRGPGKAPRGRGSRSKKAGSSRSDPSRSTVSSKEDCPPSEYDLDALAPELRPYTSVLSLDDFDFQPPPDPSPATPDTRDRLMRDYYSRTSTRTPRNRETSSEGYSYRQLG